MSEGRKHSVCCAGGLAWLMTMIGRPDVYSCQDLFDKALALLKQLLCTDHLAQEQVNQTAATLMQMRVLQRLAPRLRPAFIKGEEREAAIGLPSLTTMTI